VAAGTLALLEHPAQLEALRAELHGTLDSAVEELLRWVSPVIYMRRTATTDLTIGHTEVSAGDKVVMYYGSANRDEAAFTDPDTLDIRRRPNDHVAFGGGGPHFCVGARIGRAEIRSVMREVLTRLVDLEPAGPVEWLPSNFISGPKHFPVRFRPGAAVLS